MDKDEFELTKAEEKMMEFFWNTDNPLTATDISQNMDQFNYGYILRLIKSLEKKKMLKVCGLQQSGKQYARQFVPTMTRAEYGAIVIRNLGIEEEELAKVAVAMVQKSNNSDSQNTDELIQELENIIAELKKG